MISDTRAHPTLSTRPQSGATMVEFAIALIVVVLLFGAIFDIGLGLHRYAMFKQVTTESTRQIAVRLQTHRDCSYIQTHLRDVATEQLQSHLAPGSSPHWSATWSDSNSGILFPVFRLQGRMKLKCYFLCAMFPDGIPVNTSSEIVIERTGIGQNGGGCPPVQI